MGNNTGDSPSCIYCLMSCLVSLEMRGNPSPSPTEDNPLHLPCKGPNAHGKRPREHKESEHFLKTQSLAWDKHSPQRYVQTPVQLTLGLNVEGEKVRKRRGGVFVQGVRQAIDPI